MTAAARHHRPCPCGAELADECPRCARLNPLGAFQLEQIRNTFTSRPAGQPGTVRGAFEYPAILDEQTGVVRYWRDTESATASWLVAPPVLAGSFMADEEWKAGCDHVHALPWQTCAFESDCLSLRREDERVWGDRR